MKNEIKLTLIGSNSMMADPLTKSISGPSLNTSKTSSWKCRKCQCRREC